MHSTYDASQRNALSNTCKSKYQVITELIWEELIAQRLSGVLSAEELTRWEDLELSQSLQRMPDVVYCPRCSAACLEDGDNCAQCSKCFYAFCSLCDESWHPGIQVCDKSSHQHPTCLHIALHILIRVFFMSCTLLLA